MKKVIVKIAIGVLPIILKIIANNNPSLKDAFNKSEALVAAIKEKASDGVIDKSDIISLSPDITDVFFTIYSLISKKSIEIKIK